MDIQTQPTLLAAFKEVMKTGIAAITLSMEELFFLANEYCSADQRIRYGDFLRFTKSLDEYGEPTTTNEQTAKLLEIHDYLKAQQALQTMQLLDGIAKGEKDWRRLVWLLEYQPKQERQKAATARQLAKEAKEKKQAAEAAAKLAEPLAEKALQPKPDKQPNAPRDVIDTTAIRHNANAPAAIEIPQKLEHTNGWRPLQRI
jgi:hypothetical protein